jgi:exodeoxyribonuclease V gamma subunit
MNIPNFFFSNSIEQLFSDFQKCLFENTEAFTRRIVVVPNIAMKNWLMLNLAKEKVAMGIEVILLSQAMEKIGKKISTKDTWPSPLDLALSIETEIRAIDESDLWKPLHDYLKPGSKRSQKRIVALSTHLASLFLHYGRYAGEMVERWEKTPIVSWQQELWKRVFNHWTYDYKFLRENQEQQDLKLHFFALSFLPLVQHRFFASLSSNYYVLSPCLHFWGDIKTDPERKKIHSYISDSNIKDEFDDYLRNTNSLLANFGKVGREFSNFLEDTPHHKKFRYILNSEVAQLDEYQEKLYEEILIGKGKYNLLSVLQSDILLMCNPQGKKEIQDSTIQIHIAPSRYREVQILYDNILKIDNIVPQDIIVMAPNIMDYKAYIHAIFGDRESLLDYQLVDLCEDIQNPVIKSFMGLLDLVESRWDVDSILQIFDCPYFQKKHNLSEDDIAKIREWVEQTGVFWGHDSDHRQELIGRDYTGKAMIEKSSAATWQFGINRVLLGLSMVGDDVVFENQKPLPTVEFSDTVLLDKLITILKSLRSDLYFLCSDQILTFKTWLDYFHCIFESYFSVDDKEYVAELLSKLSYMSSVEMRDQKFPFATIFHHLKQALSTETASYNSNNLNTIKFCSMLPMRAIPARVVCLLGMDDESFPRYDKRSSLNEAERGDYCPSKTDYDRYLFLEALLSAREYFIVSYVGRDSLDQKEQLPSLVISELMSYLGKSYTNPPQPIKHPTHPFHWSYYSGGAQQSFSKRHYKAAQIYYQQDKEKLFCFIPELLAEGESKEGEVHDVDLRDLMRTAQNPLSSYFNKTLLINLFHKDALPSEEPFTISAFKTGLFRNKAITTPVDIVLDQAFMEGNFPIGPFREIAEKRIVSEVKQQEYNLAKLNVNPLDIYSVKLSVDCVEPRENNGVFEYPALQIPFGRGKIAITGHFKYVTDRGLLVSAADKLVDVAKVWPAFLVYRSLNLGENLLLLKSGKAKQWDNPVEELKSFLGYHFHCLANPSPLVPDWLAKFINKDRERLSETIKKNMETSKYLKWSCSTGVMPSAEILMDKWSETAEKVYGSLVKKWYPKT